MKLIFCHKFFLSSSNGLNLSWDDILTKGIATSFVLLLIANRCCQRINEFPVLIILLFSIVEIYFVVLRFTLLQQYAFMVTQIKIAVVVLCLGSHCALSHFLSL